MKIIMECVFGSHLYGTNTPNSDKDIKGIFMPTEDEILLQRVPKSINLNTNKSNEKNSKEDVDKEYYSLHYFIELLTKGETVALDMIHCPKDKLLKTTLIWYFLQNLRDQTYTKNLKAYVGYCRKQASKYGVKGSRLAVCKDAMKIISSFPIDNRLSTYLEKLPIGEHSRVYFDEKANLRIYEICGRKIQETCTGDYAYSIIGKYYTNYGARAKLAAENKGIDWKAISHAFRAGLQLKEILTTGDLKYPLKDADFLKKIKSGEFHYKNDNIGKQLEQLMDEIEELTKKSNYPDKIDRKFWDNVLIDLVKMFMVRGDIQ